MNCSCIKCGCALRFPQICSSCHTLQPELAGASAFELLGMPAQLRLDGAQLERNYLELNRALHPDFFAAASAAEQSLSLRHSSRLNESYRHLKNDWDRAQILLRHLAPGFKPDLKSTPPGLLMESLECNEALERLACPGALTADQQQQLDVICDKNKEQLNELWKRVENLFERLAVASADKCDAICREIQLQFNSRKYYGNVLAKIEQIRFHAPIQTSCPPFAKP